MILIVDDRADIRDMLSALLRLDGFEAATAGSGRDALAYLERDRPQCVLLDFNMPEMDGLEVLRRIRADHAMDGVRVIMFSAQGDELRQKALAAGADGYVQKASLDFAELQRQLLRYCRPTLKPVPIDSLELPTHRDVG